MIAVGARPHAQLSLGFLAAVLDLWRDHPGIYKVEIEESDLIPALAHMSLTWLLAEIRDRHWTESGVEIKGQLRYRSGKVETPSLKDVANKVVHGDPERVEVDSQGQVTLHYVPAPEARRESWIEIAFCGNDLLRAVRAIPHFQRQGEESRKSAARDLIESAGVERFLPSRVGADDLDEAHG